MTVVTNQTNNDYFFNDSLRLPAGVGTGQVTIDDPTYNSDDTVAATLNSLYAAGKVTVASQPSNFPRPVGSPQVLVGRGSPEGVVLAPQGSLFLRSDGSGATNVYTKTTGSTLTTGWITMAAGSDIQDVVYPVLPPGSYTTYPVANKAYLTKIVVTAPFTLNSINFRVAVQSGNLDMGIYDSAFNKVWSKGSTACPAVGMVSWAVTGVVLQPGVYFIASAADNTTSSQGQCVNVNSGVSNLAAGKGTCYNKSTAFPLPSSLSGAADGSDGGPAPYAVLA